MAPKTLILFGLFAVLLVVSEMALATQPGMVKPESEETVQPDGYGGGYGGRGGHGGYRGGHGGYRGGHGGYRGGHGGYRGGHGGYGGKTVQTQPGQ